MNVHVLGMWEKAEVPRTSLVRGEHVNSRKVEADIRTLI